VSGRVCFVGAGPGDPGLLTARALELIAAADVILYDRLIPAQALAGARGDAELRYVGKEGGGVSVPQEQIEQLMLARAGAGALVVRLKGGDPFVFGRGGEEALAVRAAGIPFEVVPGVTAGIAAPAYAGIPVTHRGVSTHFTVVTGHEDPTKDRTDVDWDALARTGGTLVILMGAARVGAIAERLMAAGLAADTPVAAVRNGTRFDQETVRATLATIGDANVRAPSAVVVGAVAGLDLAWFEQRPLFGSTIVVTRAREQASDLRTQLEALGAEVVELPAITIEPVDFTLPDLATYEWIVFTSVNGVRAWFERGFGPAGLDARAFAGVRIAAIGPGTAGALGERGIRVDLLPERFVAESLLDAFPDPSANDARVLLARAERARDVLPEGLAARGYTVDVLPVYRTVTASPDAQTLARVRVGDVSAITFTSSSTVRNFVDLVGPFACAQPLVASIGPVTSETARELGLRVDAEAVQHTIRGLVAAVVGLVASQ
jgi:uroporphyrinogen III methyltransferase/synthase